MIRIFKTRSFARWAKKEKIHDRALITVVDELEAGLIDANLGRGLIKKRVARTGFGKRGGYRVLLALKIDYSPYVFFIFGFSKTDKETLDVTEKDLYKSLAKHYLSLTAYQLSKLIEDKLLIEVYYEKNKNK